MTALRFETLRLVNFGSFVDEYTWQIDKGPGLWYIAGRNLVDKQMGANGAGKTTLLNALYWVITGRTMRSKRPGARVEARKGRGSTEVELLYRKGRDEHHLLRTRKPNTLTLDGNPVTEDELIAELGIDTTMLQYMSFFGQSALMFMSIGREEQAQLFNDLPGLDVWPKVAARAGGLATQAKSTVFTKQGEINNLTGEIAGLRSARKIAKAQAATFEEETKAKLEEHYAKLRKLRNDITKAEKALDALGPVPDLTQLSDKIVIISNRIDGLKTKRATWVRELDRYNDRLLTDRKALEDINNAKCPVCEQTLPLSIQKNKIARLKESILLAKNNIKGGSFQIDTIDGDLESWVEKEAVARKRFAAANKDTKHQEAAAELRVLENQRALLDKEIEHLGRTPNPHGASERLMLKNINKNKALLAEAHSDHEFAEQELSIAEMWQTNAKEIRLSIIDEVLEETAAMATKHAERLGLRGLRVALATERQTTTGTTSLGFTALLYPPGEDTGVAWETYCGGEETRLQLAMSLGLSDVLLGAYGVVPNIEFYDEPTRGLSAEGISDLLESLSERARETGKTIYFIDHHSLSAADFSGMLTVEKSRTGSHIVEG
jgi:DNA repair exonuclease SbcCD ATPase subunit